MWAILLVRHDDEFHLDLHAVVQNLVRPRDHRDHRDLAGILAAMSIASGDRSAPEMGGVETEVGIDRDLMSP